jgi:hypothetical protein
VAGCRGSGAGEARQHVELASHLHMSLMERRRVFLVVVSSTLQPFMAP